MNNQIPPAPTPSESFRLGQRVMARLSEVDRNYFGLEVTEFKATVVGFNAGGITVADSNGNEYTLQVESVFAS